MRILFFLFIFFFLSYFILWFIYRILFKSKEKVSKFLVFLGGIGLFIFYYTPYSFYLEPSYWEFRNICKINELPNDEYKYNKILSYFDTDLDSLDYEELNKRTWKLGENSGDYKKGVFEYETLSKGKDINFRFGITAGFLSNESPINRYNINQMSIYANWHSRRFFPDGNEGSGFYWREGTLGCAKVVKYNYNTKKEKNNDK